MMPTLPPTSIIIRRLFFASPGWLGLAALLLVANGCSVVPPKPEPRPAEPQVSEKVLTLARSLCGKPYRYGGSSPAGFDCSGFVQYVFRHAAGIKLPRTGRQQFAETCALALGKEAPGDLVFYKIKGGGPSHVGIYLGKGLFVHAPSSGGVVKISDANEAYWREHFIGVRRIYGWRKPDT
jgi:cell wall-associated NlpC family hydrolase